MTYRSALPDFPGLAGCAAALAAVCALAWASLATTALPPPAGAGAPADAFSAGRAAVHLQALARTPRPIASSMNEDARRYIVGQLRAMGFEPEVQETAVVRRWMDHLHNVRVTLAMVHNVIVRRPGAAIGHAARPALLLAAHYDSGAGTLGASDASSSAALLETLRALKAGPPLANDVVALFADGDAVGEMGEMAFVEQHPLAQRIGLALRFHDLGNEGPVIPQAGHGDTGAAIAAWARSAAHPRGTSLMREVSTLMPNARDIGPLANLKAPLLQFAAVQGRLGNWDTPERFDRATLQHEGDTMLSLARELGAQPLQGEATQPDQLFFKLPLGGIVHYSAHAGWGVAGLACLLLAGVCGVAIRSGRTDLADIVKGAFGYAMCAGIPLIALYLDGLHGIHAWFALGQSGAHYVAGVALVIAGLFVLGQRTLCERIGVIAASLGALAWLAAVLLASTWLAPGATYLIAWPLLFATLAIGVLQLPRAQSLPLWVAPVLLTAGVLPAVALAVPAARDAFTIPTPFRMHLPLWLSALVLGVCVPLLAAAARRFTVRAAVLGAAVLFAVPGSASAPAEAPRGPAPLVYYKDMPTWSEWWLSTQPERDDWTRKLFPHQAKPIQLVDVLGWNSKKVWYTKAPRNAVEFPYAIQLVSDHKPVRRIAFDLTSKNRAPCIELHVGGGKPWHATLNGQVLSDDPEIRNWSMSIYGMQDRPMHFDMKMFGGIILVKVEEHIPGLPAASLPVPEPAGAYIPMTGETIAVDEMWFQ